MKNVTITLPEEVVRWARGWAAERETSVSRMLAEMLRDRMERERGYEEAMKRFLTRKPATLKDGEAGYPSRDELHERHNLR